MRVAPVFGGMVGVAAFGGEQAPRAHLGDSDASGDVAVGPSGRPLVDPSVRASGVEMSPPQTGSGHGSSIRGNQAVVLVRSALCA